MEKGKGNDYNYNMISHSFHQASGSKMKMDMSCSRQLNHKLLVDSIKMSSFYNHGCLGQLTRTSTNPTGLEVSSTELPLKVNKAEFFNVHSTQLCPYLNQLEKGLKELRIQFP